MTAHPRDLELHGHARRFAPRMPAVRLNGGTSRLVDAPLVVVGLASLLALRAQHSCRTQDTKPRSSRLEVSAGKRRSDAIRDRERLAERASMNLGPAPARRPASLPAGKTLTDAELEAQRRVGTGREPAPGFRDATADPSCDSVAPMTRHEFKAERDRCPRRRGGTARRRRSSCAA